MPPVDQLERRVVDTAAGPVVVHTSSSPADRAVLLIHGAAGSWTTWIPLLARAQAAGRPLAGVVAVDLPGWGESPDPLGPFDADAAADALARVLEQLGHDRWVVAGHSLGGVVALALAARRPTATEGVLLVSPTGPAVLDALHRPVRGGLRLPWFAGMLVAMRVLAALPGEGRGLLHAIGRVHGFGVLAAPLFTGPVPRDVADLFADEVRPAAFLRAARAASRTDLAAWSRITAPVLAIRGRRDVFTGRTDAVELGRRIPRFREEVLEDAGHFATAERPDAVLAALERLPTAG